MIYYISILHLIFITCFIDISGSFKYTENGTYNKEYILSLKLVFHKKVTFYQISHFNNILICYTNLIIHILNF